MLVDDLLHKPNFLEPKNLSGKASSIFVLENLLIIQGNKV